MSIFMKKLTVNQAINEAHTTDNAMLIDCRPKDEFNHGHVTGAINIPLDKITEYRITRRLPDKTTRLYIIGSRANAGWPFSVRKPTSVSGSVAIVSSPTISVKLSIP